MLLHGSLFLGINYLLFLLFIFNLIRPILITKLKLLLLLIFFNYSYKTSFHR